MNDIAKTETGVQQAESPAAALIKMATESGAGVEVIEKMVQMYNQERDDSRRQEFNQAMTAAQMEMRPVSADATNPQTHSKYASYPQLDNKLRPIYTRHGLGLSFNTEPVTGEEELIRVICIVMHQGGFERLYSIEMPCDGKGAKGGAVMTKTHAAGSAVSYGMRYLLKMIFNVSVGEADDDGNAAGGGIITDEQAAYIKAKIKESKMEQGRIDGMLKFADCDSIESIPLSKYAKVRSVCDKAVFDVKDLPI